LPGEVLTIRNGEIYINGKRLDEPYTKGRTNFKSRDNLLEPNQYWLIGDNREVSEQYFKYDYQIVGKLLF
jgi:signal peptidase I